MFTLERLRCFRQMGLQTNKLNCFRPNQFFFFGDYGDSLETRTTAIMIENRRFMANGEISRFNFPDDVNRLGNEKFPRVYMLQN